jgi:hypothetical protein
VEGFARCRERQRQKRPPLNVLLPVGFLAYLVRHTLLCNLAPLISLKEMKTPWLPSGIPTVGTSYIEKVHRLQNTLTSQMPGDLLLPVVVEAVLDLAKCSRHCREEPRNTCQVLISAPVFHCCKAVRVNHRFTPAPSPACSFVAATRGTLQIPYVKPHFYFYTGVSQLWSDAFCISSGIP